MKLSTIYKLIAGIAFAVSVYGLWVILQMAKATVAAV